LPHKQTENKERGLTPTFSTTTDWITNNKNIKTASQVRFFYNESQTTVMKAFLEADI
jgi:hypothetical protein